MGPGQSSEGGHIVMAGNDLYMPVSAARTSNQREVVPQPVSILEPLHQHPMLKTAFAGIWSVDQGQGVGPCARTGQFYAYDPENHMAYIGYGTTVDHHVLGDVWALNILSHSWREIKLNGNPVSPRTGARACLIGTHLLIFGGYAEPHYLTGLHTIDVNTGQVNLVNTTGPQPSPRTFPITAIYENRFFVWGGYNGEWPNSIHVLDFSSWEWTEFPTDIMGRTAVPYTVIGPTLYSFGGSKTGGLLEIDLKNPSATIVQTHGAEPVGSIIGGGMVAVENFLVYFGGRSPSPWTLVYACDVTRNWWFVFHVVPDGETTTIADGSITDSGLFQLPRLNGFGVIYEPKTREIVAFLGAPEHSPPPLFVLEVGPALAVIHLRDDMIAHFHFENPQIQN